MKTSLIITTYNRPDALALVLKSVAGQSVLPDEVVIADDGSDDRTRELITQTSKDFRSTLHHAWQDDKGFRAARVRNLAAAQSAGDYLIFLDGDMILHPEFIASHIRNARDGYLLHAKRAMLGPWRTKRVLDKNAISISPFSAGITLRRYAFHIPLLSQSMSYDSTDWYDTQSANMSLWKKDLLAVNGFNEDFEGWGREDSELALRLIRSGLTKRELRFCAVTFHLAHGKDNKLKSPDSTTRNQALLDAIAASQIVRCVNGIDKHLKD